MENDQENIISKRYFNKKMGTQQGKSYLNNGGADNHCKDTALHVESKHTSIFASQKIGHVPDQYDYVLHAT